MPKILRIGLRLLALGCIATMNAGDATGRTFFSVRPHFQSGSPERETQFQDERIEVREDGHGGAFQIVAYGGQSSNSDDLTKYFLPFGRKTLRVSEFKPNVVASESDTQAKDIEALNFNIQTNPTGTTTFSSIVSFHPKQQFEGIGISYKQTIWRGDDDRPFLWFDISVPIEHVRNSMNLKEQVVSDGGGVYVAFGLDDAFRVGSMTDAFKQANWTYGKINNKKCLSKWGVADVEFKLNWATHWSPCCRLDSYIGFVAPTGTKIDKKNAAYVFSPVIGNNHHWGFLLGGTIDFELWSNERSSLHVLYNMANRILADNVQVRSFDLKGKPWSRYIEVYGSLAQAQEAFNAPIGSVTSENIGSSGINFFTKPIEVSPRYSADNNVSFVYRHSNWVGEIGYNLYIRQAETVHLHKKNCKKGSAWTETIAIKSIEGAGSLSNARTIAKNFFLSDAVFTPVNFAAYQIQESDLDLDSAAHPAVISNTVYADFGYAWDECKFPLFIGIGGSYEFSSINTTLTRWTVWGKFGLSY